MKVIIHFLGAFMWLVGAEAWATSVGWRDIPDIMNKYGMPALCLPAHVVMPLMQKSCASTKPRKV